MTSNVRMPDPKGITKSLYQVCESLPSSFPPLHNKGLHASWKATNRINPISVDSFIGVGPTESSATALVRNSLNLRGDWGTTSRGSPPFFEYSRPPLLRFQREGRQESCLGLGSLSSHRASPFESTRGLGQRDSYCW